MKKGLFNGLSLVAVVLCIILIVLAGVLAPPLAASAADPDQTFREALRTQLQTLLPGYVLIGNAASNAVGRAVSGDATISTNGVVSLAADVIAPAEMADADHGDFSWASGVGSIDADVVDAANIAPAGLCQSSAADIATTTAYTPAFVGQLLIETANSDGTNNIWCAAGSTTNSWVAIK